MPVIEASRKMENTLGVGGSYWAFGLYEFALDGGAVGDIALRGAPVIPSGAVIINALIYVDTVPTSGGAATIAIKTEGAADINAADAISGAPWSSTGAKRGDFDADTAPILTTAARTITATVATAALTAGKFSVFVEYIVVR